ncbi:MAG: sulfatase-like hydrolase/transferase [Rikenellaceae bacterium]
MSIIKNSQGSSLLLGAAAMMQLTGCATAPTTTKTTLNNNSQVILDEYKKVFGEAPELVDYNAERPNILFITSDQHFWMGLGFNDPTIKTPNLDRLAELGVVFDRAYTCNPVSTPTRSSMITGLMPSQHGAYALGTKLSEDVPTIGNYLGDAGYATSLVGKAHFMPLAGTAQYPTLEGYPVLQDLDFWREYKGPFYGFEDACLARNHADESHVGQHYAIWMEEKLKENGQDPNSWKNWFLKVGEIPYANISDEMRRIVEEHGALGVKQQGVWNIPEEYHLNAWIADETNNRIDKFAKEGKPFFLWASFFDPHPPYLIPEPWVSMYRDEDMIIPDVPADDLDDMPHQYRMTQVRDSKWAKEYFEDGFPVHGLGFHDTDRAKLQYSKRVYYGMISMMDKYIGLILDNLEKNNILDKTMIIFTTDHGHHIGTHNLDKKGGFAFEEDLRIPFIVSWKGHYPENKRTDALVSVVDLAPTFLRLAGYKETPTMSGVDLDPLFRGDVEKARDWVIAENHFQRTIFYQKTYIEDRYKITWYMNSDEGELFDLKNDPHEYENLWDKAEYQKLKLDMLLNAVQADMKAEPCWMPRIGPA